MPDDTVRFDAFNETLREAEETNNKKRFLKRHKKSPTGDTASKHFRPFLAFAQTGKREKNSGLG